MLYWRGDTARIGTVELAEEVGVEPTRPRLEVSTALKAARPTGDDALPRW